MRTLFITTSVVSASVSSCTHCYLSSVVIGCATSTRSATTGTATGTTARTIAVPIRIDALEPKLEDDPDGAEQGNADKSEEVRHYNFTTNVMSSTLRGTE